MSLPCQSVMRCVCGSWIDAWFRLLSDERVTRHTS